MKVRTAARYQARNRRLRRRIAFRAYVTITLGPVATDPDPTTMKRVAVLLDTAIVPAVRVLTVTDAEDVKAFFSAIDAKNIVNDPGFEEWKSPRGDSALE